MLDRSKVEEFFDAQKIKAPVTIVGCGATGSHACEQIARMGFEHAILWDFDTVDDHNITNQMFKQEDIGKAKVTACAEMMNAVNPDMQIEVHNEPLEEPYVVNGIVIICVDNIEVHQKIVEANEFNPNCMCFLDFRMRLTDAQVYFATNDVYAPQKDADLNKLKRSMNFTHNEAKEATPISACGVELSVIYTVKTCVALGMATLVRYLTGKTYHNTILIDLDNIGLITL